MSVEIVFETHSISEDNEAGLATGWLPGRLSTRGRELALELGDRRTHDGLSIVYTSDLRRAVETAELAFGGTAGRAGAKLGVPPRAAQSPRMICVQRADASSSPAPS